jgi:hypothetical protein
MADGIFQGNKVSDPWDVILTDAAKRVSFRLNSGRRTMAEQTHLWKNRGKPGFAALVAFPNPNAPHIMLGRDNHSLDVDTNVGAGENALQAELHRMGLVIVNDVVGEPWHMTEKDQARLRKAAARIEANSKAHEPLLFKGVKPDRAGTLRLQRLLRGAGVTAVPLNGKYDLATRAAVKRFQRKHGIKPTTLAHVYKSTWDALRKVNA